MAHDAVRDVVGVEFRSDRLMCGGVGRKRGERIVFPDGAYTANDFWPGDRLDVFLNQDMVV